MLIVISSQSSFRSTTESMLKKSPLAATVCVTHNKNSLLQAQVQRSIILLKNFIRHEIRWYFSPSDIDVGVSAWI